MLALVEEACGRHSLAGVVVAVQGLGSVGMRLAHELVGQGAQVIATDVRPALMRLAEADLGIEVVAPEAIYDVPCDIFAPCALGATIDDETIPRLRCRIVAGCANNQLAGDAHGERLHQLGIWYGVDYVINAGGLMNAAQELEGHHPASARAKVSGIYDTVKRLISISKSERVSMLSAARHLALEHLRCKMPSAIDMSFI
jgi:leucine dehydrogenase